MAVLPGKLAARRRACAPAAGKTTLNRLELSRPSPRATTRSATDPAAIEALFVDSSWRRTSGRRSRSCSISTPRMIRSTASRRADSSMATTAVAVATIHLLRPASAGSQAAAGQYRRRARLDRAGLPHRQTRARWSVGLRADAGFARRWPGVRTTVSITCSAWRATRANRGVRNRTRRGGRRERCKRWAGPALQGLMWTTRKSWSSRRRVVGKAKWTRGAATPLVVTSLDPQGADAPTLYEDFSYACGEMENRIQATRLAKPPAVPCASSSSISAPGPRRGASTSDRRSSFSSDAVDLRQSDPVLEIASDCRSFAMALLREHAHERLPAASLRQLWNATRRMAFNRLNRTVRPVERGEQEQWVGNTP
jgi:hypothetical protein